MVTPLQPSQPNTKEISAVVDAWTRGDVGDAILLARKLADASPPALDALIGVADELIKANSIPQALSMLLPYASRFPDHAPLHWRIALAYGGIYQHGNAEPHLRMVATRKAHWPDAQFAMGRNLSKAGRSSEAVPFFRQTLALQPNHADALFLLSLALETEEEYAEALDLMRRAVAANPANETARQHLAELEQIITAPPPASTFARWPKSAKQFDDVQSLIDSYVVKNYDRRGIALRRGMGVFTQGSCFAGNLAISLRRYDLRVGNMECGEEYNSTFANRAVVDWLRDGAYDERTSIVEENMGRDKRDDYLQRLRTADIFVYTMGLAAVHFDKTSGEFVMPRSTTTSKAALLRRTEFRTSTVAQNVDNLLYILDVVRELAPKAAVILTVSPVPMNMTSEFNSAIISDCVSKSTLRVAIHEIISKNLPRVLYWPSFEIIRWLGGHVGRVYGSDDGSAHHVDIRMINHIMDTFVNVFGDAELRASAKPDV